MARHSVLAIILLVTPLMAEKTVTTGEMRHRSWLVDRTFMDGLITEQGQRHIVVTLPYGSMHLPKLRFSRVEELTTEQLLAALCGACEEGAVVTITLRGAALELDAAGGRTQARQLAVRGELSRARHALVELLAGYCESPADTSLEHELQADRLLDRTVQLAARGAELAAAGSLWSELLELAERARDGKTRPDDVGGGTFTITNAGNIGGLLATPIINVPEVAIMGVHAIRRRPWVVDDEIVIRDIMYLSLSLDHRVVDGAVGARFMNRVKELIENPALMLLES